MHSKLSSLALALAFLFTAQDSRAQCELTYTNLPAPSQVRSNLGFPLKLFGSQYFWLFGARDPWLELDLLPDSQGQPAEVATIRVAMPWGTRGDITILARRDSSSPWAILRREYENSVTVTAPPTLRIGSLRFEYRTGPQASTIFESIVVEGAAVDASLRVVAIPWYGQPISAAIYGSYSAFTLRTCWRSSGVDLGRMFASVPPLSSTPFGLPSWFGGFLLNPGLFFVMEDRILSGRTSWDFSLSGILDPAFHGAELSFQALLVDLQASGDPLLIWTNPVIVGF